MLPASAPVACLLAMRRGSAGRGVPRGTPVPRTLFGLGQIWLLFGSPSWGDAGPAAGWGPFQAGWPLGERLAVVVLLFQPGDVVVDGVLDELFPDRWGADRVEGVEGAFTDRVADSDVELFFRGFVRGRRRWGRGAPAGSPRWAWVRQGACLSRRWCARPS